MTKATAGKTTQDAKPAPGKSKVTKGNTAHSKTKRSKTSSPEVKARPLSKRKQTIRSPGSHAKTANKPDTKKQIILNCLSRNAGASLGELSVATGWQVHSIRGFLAGTVRKKLGLPLVSEKLNDGERRYFLRGNT